MSGVTVHEAMGRTIIELFPELSNSRLASAVTATIEFGQSAHLSRSLNRAPFPLYAMPIGSEAPNRPHQTINIQPLGEGWPGCQIQVFDATPEAVREAKLRQQAKAMRVSEAKYRILAESSTVGIWQFDRQGRTINANQAMCNILGVDGVDALMEMSLSDFVDDDAKGFSMSDLGKKVGRMKHRFGGDTSAQKARAAQSFGRFSLDNSDLKVALREGRLANQREQTGCRQNSHSVSGRQRHR